MHLDELVTLADEKGSFFWKAIGMAQRGCVMALTGKASDAVHVLTSGITASRSTGATLWMPLYFHAWRALILILGNSMTLGAASAKP